MPNHISITKQGIGKVRFKQGIEEQMASAKFYWESNELYLAFGASLSNCCTAPNWNSKLSSHLPTPTSNQ
jgi:hypothetical protein